MPLLFSLNARRVASQDPPLRSAGALRNSLLTRLAAGNLEVLQAVLAVWLRPPDKPHPDNPNRKTNTVSVRRKLTMSS
jgi:hypothetical protein